MLGLLLRSELIQSSAVRTWNCVSNIANFVWIKINNLRLPVMPRSRRRHHSRSRSRSHSHDRDREAKRRRIESPESHHRRSISVESDVVEKNDTEKIEASLNEESKISQTEDVIMKSPPKEKETSKKISPSRETENKTPPKENTEKSTRKESPEKSPVKENIQETSKENPEETSKSPKDTPMDSKTESPDPKTKDVIPIDSSDTEMDQSLNASHVTDLDESIVLDPNITPKKNIIDLKGEKGSSKKKNPQNHLSKEERERKRLEEKEERERLKREKIEQKIKERQEKEEQKRKEREEKEEQRRKEKEEKEEQKRKEKEEKEEQKRKEREEKEELKRKEREEKEAQKIKEREEKEELKRKEKEEKELKKQQELEKEKKKMEKESAAFLNFFAAARKSTGNLETKKCEEIVSSNTNFMPFQIKAGMRLAPSTRRTLTEEQKETLLSALTEQNQTDLFLSEIKSRPLGKDTKTWPVEDDEIQVLDDTGIGECVEEQKVEKQKMRAKYLLFHENRRPAYHGTWRKKSKNIRPRNPFGEDKEIFDYEVDSDDDWEEEEPGESLHGSDDEKENDSDEYEVDNEFFVPHGYLSDEEMEKENEEKADEVNPEHQQEKLKLLQQEFEEEMKSKTERIKPRLIGCIWESKLKPKIQDAISSFLEDRMMIIPAPIVIKKRELNKENINSTTKTSTPSRKQLSKELIPEFLKMIHGNTNNKIYLVNEFLNYLSSNHKDITVSKAGLTYQMKELASWKKCPDEGVMYNKNCWYVEPEVRERYNLNVSLPNKWSLAEENSNAKKKLSL